MRINQVLIQANDYSCHISMNRNIKKHHWIYIYPSSTAYIWTSGTTFTTVEKFLTGLSEPVHGGLSFS